MLSSGDTLYIRGGWYNEGIGVNGVTNLPSGTSWSTATVIAGYPGETVQLGGDISTDFWSGQAYLGVVRYVIFQNFVLDGHVLSAHGCNIGVYDPNCGPHFIRFKDIEVKNNPATGVGAN